MGILFGLKYLLTHAGDHSINQLVDVDDLSEDDEGGLLLVCGLGLVVLPYSAIGHAYIGSLFKIPRNY